MGAMRRVDEALRESMLWRLLTTKVREMAGEGARPHAATAARPCRHPTATLAATVAAPVLAVRVAPASDNAAAAAWLIIIWPSGRLPVWTSRDGANKGYITVTTDRRPESRGSD